MRNPAQWCDVFLTMAEQIAKRSKDSSTQCGAVLISPDNLVLGVGFNGPPPQVDDSRVPWDERNPSVPNKYDFIIHAEENALLAAYESHGRKAMQYSTMYITSHPCHHCILRMVRAGVTTCVWPKKKAEAKCVDEGDKDKSKAILAAVKLSAPKLIGYEVSDRSGNKVL